MTTSPTTPWIGRVIDERYRVIERLGEGGMGAVYVAEHLKLRKQVAIKTIRAEFAAHSQAEARFAREALATAQLDHPHVASAIDFGPLPEGGHYLVMQLVRGESLTKRLGRGALAWREVCELGAQVADALASAHALGIVHRDLKPDNVLLERRDDGALHAKVLDFGVAHVAAGALAGATQALTRLGSVIGTPGYMAPEQAVGGEVDARADLYALGAILWECVTGQPLWEGDSAATMFAAQLSRPAPSLHGLGDAAPAGLAALVDRLLVRAVAERPAKAAAVRDELRRLALGPGPTPAATPPVVAPAAARTTAPDPPRSRRVRPLALAAGIFALAAALWLARGTPAEAPAAGPARATAPAPAGPGRRELPPRQELVAQVPPAFEEHARALLLSDDRRERARAGEAIAGAPEAVKSRIPEYLRNLAWLEKVDDCEARLAILQKIDEADDIRALWGLRILAEQSRDACSRERVLQLAARFEALAE